MNKSPKSIERVTPPSKRKAGSADLDQDLIDQERSFPPPAPRPEFDEQLIGSMLSSASADWGFMDGGRIVSFVARAIIAANPSGISQAARLQNVLAELFVVGKKSGRPTNDLQDILLKMAESYVEDRSFDQSKRDRRTGATLRRRPRGNLPIDELAAEAVKQIRPGLDDKERETLERAAADAFSSNRITSIEDMQEAATQLDSERVVALAIGHVLAAAGVKINLRLLEPPNYRDWSTFDAGDAYLEQMHAWCGI